MDDVPCPMSLPPPPTRSAPPRLPLELVVQIATLIAQSPQADGLPSLAALALASRSFAGAVAPLLTRAAVYYDADRYLAWPPAPPTSTTATAATTTSTADDAQVAALMEGFDRCSRDKDDRLKYGAGPVLLFACRAGRADLVQELVRAASRIYTLGEGSRSIETTRTAGAGAEHAGTPLPPRRTAFLSPQTYLGAHFWVPFTCAHHMPRVWRLEEGYMMDGQRTVTVGDGGRHDEMEGLFGKTTALHVTAQYGQLEVAEVILAHMMITTTGTSTSTSTTSYWAPPALDMPATLACTCPSAHMSAVAESTPDPLDWPWATPVVVALSHGHKAVARRLIVAGAAWDYAPHWVGTGGISATHVAAAQRMAGMLEWLGEQKEKGQQHQRWVDWPDADGRFMLHHVCDAEMDPALRSSLHPHSSSGTSGDGDNSNLSRLLGAISRLGAFSRPSRRRLQTHIDSARARARALSSSSPLLLKSLADMEQDQMGVLAAGYMTGGDDDMLQPAAEEYAMELGLQQVARQMEEAGLGSVTIPRMN